MAQALPFIFCLSFFVSFSLNLIRYEGGGLYRNIFLISTSGLHIPEDGIFAPAEGTGAGFSPTVEVHNDAGSGYIPPYSNNSWVFARFTIFDAEGQEVAQGQTVDAALPATGTSTTMGTTFDVPNARQWTLQQSYLYTVVVEVVNGTSMALVDSRNVSVGFRTTRWDANQGFYLNGNHTVLRGFCHHEVCISSLLE